MKTLLISLFLIPALAFGQNYLDHKIIIKVQDTVNLYEKVRVAFGTNDFVLKENGRKDFIETMPREFKKIRAFSVVNATINKDTVVLYGKYALMKNKNIGYTVAPSSYKNIIYSKKSHGWKLLMQIADKIPGQQFYSK